MKISFAFIVSSFTIFSCSMIKSSTSNSVDTDNLAEKLEGYWTNDKEVHPDHDFIFFYGKIDESGTGLYLQADKEMKYRIAKIDNANNKIVIAIKYSDTKERIETIIFSNDFERISNNHVMPFGTSINTYYVRKE